MLDVGPAIELKPDSTDAIEVAAVRTKYPEAVAALALYREAYGKHVDQYRELTITLRAQNLGPRELTMLLLAEGWNKVRASELKAVVELPPEQFEAYRLRMVGFKAALVEARSQSGAPGGGAGLARFALRPEAAAEMAKLVNAIDVSLFTQKKAVFKAERLDVTFVVTIRRKAVKPPAKKKKGKKKGKK